MTARKPFAAERRACNRVYRAITRLWRRHEPELKRLIRAGEYDAELLLRQRIYREQDRLNQEWIAIRRSMPPFVEHRHNFDYLHPVMPENLHLLRPQYLAPLTSLPPSAILDRPFAGTRS